jgi:hypothetical protein
MEMVFNIISMLWTNKATKLRIYLKRIFANTPPITKAHVSTAWVLVLFQHIHTYMYISFEIMTSSYNRCIYKRNTGVEIG